MKKKKSFFLETFKVVFSFFSQMLSPLIILLWRHVFPGLQSDMTCVIFVCGVNWHDTHNVARLLGRRL